MRPAISLIQVLLLSFFFFNVQPAYSWDCSVELDGPGWVKIGRTIVLTASGLPDGGYYSWSQSSYLVSDGSTATLTGYKPAYSDYIPVTVRYTTPKGKTCKDTKWVYAHPGCEDDKDGDGFATDSSCGPVDCNDNDATIYPGAPEVCDNKDNDCDGEIDEGQSWDRDGDAHYTLNSCKQPADDCNDNDAAIHPGILDICDNINNDCDGQIDEDCCTVTISGDDMVVVGNSITLKASGEPDGGIYKWEQVDGLAANGPDALFIGSTPTTQQITVEYFPPASQSNPCDASHDITILKVEKITASSGAATNSAEEFAGHTEWPFDPNTSGDQDPGKHLVIFYNDVVNKTDFSVNSFEIALKATVLPDSITPNDLNEVWQIKSGPDSGTLNKDDTFEIRLQTPEKGGIYKLSLDLGLEGPKSEVNIVLPLAGAEIKEIVKDDLSLADVFAEKVIKNYSWLERHNPINGYKWFYYYGAGDYAGRVNNSSSPTARYYNSVDYGGLGGVATWFGVPIRTAKASNFLVAYAVRKIGVNPVAAWVAKIRVGTSNDGSASESWDAGWDVAGGASYETTAARLVKKIFDQGDDKNMKLWPNPTLPDNHVSQAGLIDYDLP